MKEDCGSCEGLLAYYSPLEVSWICTMGLEVVRAFLLFGLAGLAAIFFSLRPP